ncbi:hypothetical protein [Nocardia altamirensis]|uniref:hypothetical protein n=1 Tax=Nocardia altamirensis TaxID=472158 RepID=UPI0008408F7D|nr:hypothetical protein [Nocardia altamirensis]
MAEQAQWTPGANQAHTWIAPWSTETIGELLREADAAGWTSYIIDSDRGDKSLSGHDDRITRAIAAPGAADQLLEGLQQQVETRFRSHRDDGTGSGTPILLVIGESARYCRDPRLLTLARLGRAADIHLALDLDAEQLLTHALGTEFRDNILGTRCPALAPTGNDTP